MSERIHSLDGLRAVAVLTVVLSHYGLGSIVPGGFGVTLFFFISGFIITHLLINEFANTSRINVKNFYVRRAVRIFPSMYLALFISYLVWFYGVYDKDVSTNAILAQIFHLTNYYSIYNSSVNTLPGTGILWSLAVEEHYYLVFPFAFYAIRKRFSHETMISIFVLVCILVLLHRLMLIYVFDATHTRVYKGTDTRIDSILWGAVLALTYNSSFKKTIGKMVNLQNKLLSISILVLLFTFLYRDEEFRQTFRYTLQGLSLLVIGWYILTAPNKFVFSTLNNPFMRYVGTISYGIYLFHFLSLYFVIWGLGDKGGLTYCLAFILTLFVSSAIYHGIEVPLMNIRKRFN